MAQLGWTATRDGMSRWVGNEIPPVATFEKPGFSAAVPFGTSVAGVFEPTQWQPSPGESWS